MSKILVVEDESHLAEGLRFNLEAEGHEVALAETGESGLEMIASGFDLLILDVMLPGIDGFQVAARLRQEDCFIPILMLTAMGRPGDVLRGFESGADDYLPKPFVLAIMLARVRGLLRRSQWLKAAPQPPAANVFEFGGKRFDHDNLELSANGQILRLTLMEANLLRYLIQGQGAVVSRKNILDDVWGVHEDTDTRAIDNFIARLRKHIEDQPSEPRHLLTVRGVGYRFVANPGTGNG